MTLLVWIDGDLQPEGMATIDVRDRGLTLGDGLFETIRVVDGAAVRLAAHLARLRAGAAVLGIDVPWSDDTLRDIISRTMHANALHAAVVRLTLTRGVPTARGLVAPAGMQPSLIVHAQPFDGYDPSLYQRGMTAITSRIRRNEHSPLASIKSLCYLDNVLARQEAVRAGADEAIMLNTVGDLACASAANIFVVVDGVLLAPPLWSGALPGTVRGAVLALVPRIGVEAREEPLPPTAFAAASEAFLTNALMGVMPLAAVDGRAIGDGQAFALARRIADALKGRSHAEHQDI